MSSYSGTQSTGIVYKKMDLTKEVEGRHIILMEDIVDTGNTIEKFIQLFRKYTETKISKSGNTFIKTRSL